MLWTLFYWALIGFLIVVAGLYLALALRQVFNELHARVAPSKCYVCQKKAESYRFEKLGHCSECKGLGKRLKYHHYFDPSSFAGSYGVNNYTCSVETCDCINTIFGDPVCVHCYQEYEAGLQRLEQEARELTETGSH
jgi:hypothetical protein